MLIVIPQTTTKRINFKIAKVMTRNYLTQKKAAIKEQRNENL